MTDEIDSVTENLPATTKPGRGLAAWQDFEAELHSREKSIAGLLPQHVSKQRFLNSAIAAVKQTPDLLKATPRSLFAAIAKSAQDGLIPDGREGVITMYNERQKNGSYLSVAQWNPMTYGLRKRARELDSILINAQVVHEHDHFVREEGDNPKIEHQPAPLGQDRGKMIGAYAVFRNDTGILHREVMDAEQIEEVRSQSKAPDSLMWKKFTQEAWRKTVIRRGIKSVPVSEKLETIARRDDDLFNFDAENGKGKRQPANVIQPPADGERKALPPVVGEPVTAAELLLSEIMTLATMEDCEAFAQRVTQVDGLSDADFREISKALMARQAELKNPGNGGGKPDDDPKRNEPDGGKGEPDQAPPSQPNQPAEQRPAASRGRKGSSALPERTMADLVTAG
jgi:recombination protein RecT